MDKQKMLKMISIIIPHYNDTEGLYTLLQSVPPINNIQVIIVDDHSTIEHNEFVKKIEILGRQNTEIYFNNGKQGAGNSRNIGLKHAKGEWILFADSDDFFVENAFDTIFELAESEKDIIYFRPTSIVLPEGIPGNRHMPYEKMVYEYLQSKNKGAQIALKSGFIVPWSKMYKRKFLTDNHITFEDVRWSNDVMFSIKSAFMTNNILVTDKVVYCATRKKGSLTTQRNKEEFRIRFEVYVRKYKFLENMLKKDELRYAINAPAGKIIKALSNKYGLSMVKYILHRYREEKIPLFYSGVGTIKNALNDQKREYGDKKFFTE